MSYDVGSRNLSFASFAISAKGIRAQCEPVSLSDQLLKCFSDTINVWHDAIRPPILSDVVRLIEVPEFAKLN